MCVYGYTCEARCRHVASVYCMEFRHKYTTRHSPLSSILTNNFFHILWKKCRFVVRRVVTLVTLSRCHMGVTHVTRDRCDTERHEGRNGRNGYDWVQWVKWVQWV